MGFWDTLWDTGSDIAQAAAPTAVAATTGAPVDKGFNFLDPDLISAGLTSIAGLASGLFGISAAEDANAQSEEHFQIGLLEAQKDRDLRMALAQLAAGSGGGGGGGAYQNKGYQLGVEAALRGAQTEQDALQNAISGVVASLKG